MIGFRPLELTRELFAALSCPELDRYLTILDPFNESDSLRGLFTTWISIPAQARQELIDAVVTAASTNLQRGDWISNVLVNVLELQERLVDPADPCRQVRGLVGQGGIRGVGVPTRVPHSQPAGHRRKVRLERRQERSSPVHRVTGMGGEVVDGAHCGSSFPKKARMG